jgi:hypothetical protein
MLNEETVAKKNEDEPKSAQSSVPEKSELKKAEDPKLETPATSSEGPVFDRPEQGAKSSRLVAKE